MGPLSRLVWRFVFPSPKGDPVRPHAPEAGQAHVTTPAPVKLALLEVAQIFEDHCDLNGPGGHDLCHALVIAFRKRAAEIPDVRVQ